MPSDRWSFIPLDIAIIALYLVGMIVVGFVVERRARGGIANYFLGGNEMPWSGYAAPNILKWHWWRFNGWGYFCGMIAAVGGALALLAFPEVKPLEAFPFLMLISAIGAILGSLLSKPETKAYW